MAHVALIGAGPAGAALAWLLARRGQAVTLVERHVDFAREFRGEVLLPGGLEALHQMGLWDEVQRVPQVVFDHVELYVDGRRRARFDLQGPGFGRFTPRWVSQPALLEMLVAQAARFPGFRLERGTVARALCERGDRIEGVRVLGPDGERELAADLVIGADGRSSAMRRRGGLRDRVDPTPMDVVWCKLPPPDPRWGARTARGYLGGGHLLIAAPVPDGRLQLGWVIRKGSFGELRARGMPACLEEMARHGSPDLAAHLRRHAGDAVEPFLLSTVLDHVERWSRPGLLLIGDAAHTMSPVGAQGLNLALRDAIVAANRLLPVLRAGAAPAALDEAARAIEAERRPEIERIQRLQGRAPQLVLARAWWARLALRLLPLLATGAARAGLPVRTAREFLFGATEVRLEV